MLSKTLTEVLVCTSCLGLLTEAETTLTCRQCGAVYAIEDGLPNMLPEEARLYCPECKRELRKSEGTGECEACGKRFPLLKRLKR